MLGDEELAAIAGTLLLWLLAGVSLLVRRSHWRRPLVLVAVLATIATLVLLRLGEGHRG